ncbi:MAG: type IV pilus biogenesis/stability protein PilW [Pseudomonadota bacterium]|nr:type IV pilus biogenesis/stability protein PilW [Pseudomonadota bacterium]
MKLNPKLLRAVPVAAVMAGLLLTACNHNPPAYQRPVRTYKKEPTKAAIANMQLAIEYMKLDQLSNARECIEKALSEDSSNPDVQMTAGLVYERINEMSKAEHAYDAANRLGKGDPNIANSYAVFLCRTGKTAAGEKLFLQVAVNPLYQTPWVALSNAGACARGAGDLVNAEKFFNRALANRPNYTEALLQLGNVAFDRGDAAQALDIVQRYLAVNPPAPEVLWLGFRAQRKLGDPVAAAVYARRVQTEFPNSEQAQNMRNGVDR